MTIPASVLVKIATIGLSAEQAEAVAEMLAAVEAETLAVVEASKAKTRERVQRWREAQPARGNVTERLAPSRRVTKRLTRADARGEDKPLTQKIEVQGKQGLSLRDVSDFESWYRHWPNKVQRGAAEAAFASARKLASLDALIDGARRYVAAKPADRPWLNPATWLNRKGWLDQPAPPPQARAGPSPGGAKIHFSSFFDAARTRARANDDARLDEPDGDPVRDLPALAGRDVRGGV